METKIMDYGMNGEGVGKVDGKIMLIDNALIDEIVEIEIVDDNKNYCTAKVVELLKPSANRQTPPCPYFYDCGGCQLQHMNYEEQLRFKTNHIKKTIKKITGLEVDVNNTIPCSKNFGYRNKISFSVHKSKIGFKKTKSNNLVEIENCPLANNEINQVYEILKSCFKTNKIDSIKNIVIRSINHQTLVGIVTSKHINLHNLFSTLSAHFVDIGLYEIINKRKDSVVLSGDVKHVGGIQTIKIDNFGVKYDVDLMGFHQTNLEIQDKLYQNVLNYIGTNSVVINGFSGQGLLTAIIAKKAKFVTGIEINKSSHLCAETLKKENNIENMKNICGDFHKFIVNEMQNANTIILDPTKKGCGPQVMNEIKGIENIIYISCNPIALSKDINIIKDEYEIQEITPFDMFPNTTSVETLVKLKRKIKENK